MVSGRKVKGCESDKKGPGRPSLSLFITFAGNPVVHLFG
jgi:hypothetical protein